MVMTGSSEDSPEWKPHIHWKDTPYKLANRFKDAKYPLNLDCARHMAVRFDASCLHTVYADKPMQDHGIACDLMLGFTQKKSASNRTGGLQFISAGL